MPALTSELFGLQHFASNYSLVQVRHMCLGGLQQGMHSLSLCSVVPDRCTCSATNELAHGHTSVTAQGLFLDPLQT